MAEILVVEKLHQDRMWVITMYDGSRKAVDEWEKTVRAYIAEFDNAPERYLVYDTTGILNLGFTNYLQQRATVLAKDNWEATGRVGIVLRIPQTILYFFDRFVRLSSSYIQPYLEVKLFSERAAAIEWVAAGVPENNKAVAGESEATK
jgi:hypothetical protein